MRRDTKRAIWWDLYNKHICIKHFAHQTYEYRLSHAAGLQMIVEKPNVLQESEDSRIFDIGH